MDLYYLQPLLTREVVKPFARHREVSVVLHPSRLPSLSSLTVSLYPPLISVPQATLHPTLWHHEGAAWIRMEKPSAETAVSVDHCCVLSHQRFLPNAACTDLHSSRTWCEQTCLLGLSVKALFLLSGANASISGWQNATWDDGFVCSLVF